MLAESVNILEVLKLSLLSMIIVFLCLLTISFILTLFKSVFYDRDNKNKVIKNENMTQKTTKEIKNSNDEQILIPLFTAAIAASNGKRVSNIRIRSINRVS